MKKYVGFIAIMLITFAILQGCGNTEADEASSADGNGGEKIVLKLAHTNAPSDQDPYTAISEEFKSIVEERTDGQVEVEIYPGGQMGGEQSAIQKVQNNVLQATMVAVNNASEYSPSLGAFDLPYMFEDVDQFRKIIDENRDVLNEKLEEDANLEALAWTQQGFRVISSSKPINTMDDMRGFKIRVPENNLQIETFKALGAEPTPMAFDELFSGLQQKVVDGQENPYVSIYTNRFQEVQDYVTETHYKLWVGPFLINKDFLDGLPEDVQTVIREAGLEVGTYSDEIITQQEEEAKNAIEESGVELLGAPEDEEVWREKSLEIWPDFYDDIGDPAILDSFMESVGREKP
ncbi:TRAP transporter substrate-binding protein [Oceanobacillus timonensis]|uniref:TRAP transporter substrate-binding protein n=1 Tax=Oceanobacillus timonensis TaxID=1926285 RepID=UPI0009BC683D|nr:TRAP transporter substrate-binding protein [Oceanobacillus timonensis]